MAQADVVEVPLCKVHAENAAHGEVIHGQPLDAEATALDLGHTIVLAAHRHPTSVTADQARACVRLELGTLGGRQGAGVDQAERGTRVDMDIHRHAVDEERLDEVRLRDAP